MNALTQYAAWREKLYRFYFEPWPTSKAMWDYRKLSKRVALDLMGVEVTEQLDWKWPVRVYRDEYGNVWSGVRFTTVAPVWVGINDQYRYIPARYLPGWQEGIRDPARVVL